MSDYASKSPNPSLHKHYSNFWGYFPTGLLNLLLNSDHDVACVQDIDRKMSDSDILAWAVREQRIIITTDSDFEQMIWVQKRLHWGRAEIRVK